MTEPICHKFIVLWNTLYRNGLQNETSLFYWQLFGLILLQKCIDQFQPKHGINKTYAQH
jgi:hypothetical protein